MKKSFIEIITKWKYTWPAWMVTTVDIIFLTQGVLAEGPAAFLWICTVSAAYLLASGKWWGCFVGSLNGVYAIGEYYYKLMTHDKIVIDSRPFGLIIIVYYLFMGWICWKENKQSSDKL